ncbi:Bro-N domain-containing protein [Buttiauxella noackiae]|uniref:BRO-N domain-containing protein n=1 Tax=Buttiauxella noackiae TaxID=82992 RepID=UPI0036F2680E
MFSKNDEAPTARTVEASNLPVNLCEKTNMKSIAKIKQSFTTFQFGPHAIRVTDVKGEPWFVAIDVCKAMGIVNNRDALDKLDDDEKSTVGLTDSQAGCGAQSISLVSESGMYTLVLRCRDAVKQGSVPHQFRKWVTNEVLPSIRKKGEYKDSQSASISLKGKECRYRVRVIIYDDLMGGIAEMFGKGETMRDIAYGVANDLGYRPNTFTQVPMDREKLKRVF